MFIDKEFYSSVILYFNVRDETGSETSDRAYCFGPENVMCTENKCLALTHGRSCVWCMALLVTGSVFVVLC